MKCCKPDSATHGTKNIIANRLMAVMGKRQRLAVLRLTVNQFPSGKHWRFNSSLPHERKHPFNHALPICEIILGYLDASSKDLNCVTVGVDWSHSLPRVFDRSKQGSRMVVQIHLRT